MTDNWDTAKTAETIEVISVNGDPTQLLVNGEPFPYLLGHGCQVNVIEQETGWSTVTITLLAEKVTETERPRSTAPQADVPESK